jgi:hypothetical protein
MPRKTVTDKNIVVSAAAPARHKPAVKRVKRTENVAAAEPVVTAEPVEAPVAQAASALPSQEQIASLAYLYWEARGCQGGSPEADWLRAEQELLAAAAIA